MREDVPVILGPTCSGKSAVAARLAAALGGEVVSFDSMQVYGALPIGTAQPGPEELSLAPLPCGQLYPGRQKDGDFS